VTPARAFGLCLTVVLMCGCLAPPPELAPRNPGEPGESTSTSSLTPTPATSSTLRSGSERNDSPDGPTKPPRSVDPLHLALRVRGVGCEGLSVGSGFAAAPNLLITNRHVVWGANNLSLNTWDGTLIEAPVVRLSVYTDLALVEVEQPLPVVVKVAEIDPEPGGTIWVVGYPGGGPPTIVRGNVVDYTRDEDLGPFGNIMRLTAPVEPGQSGGPVIDEHQVVVGVVYAVEVATGYSLALPASALRRLVDDEIPAVRNWDC
jgi:S1-C subfamily serine protease